MLPHWPNGVANVFEILNAAKFIDFKLFSNFSSRFAIKYLRRFNGCSWVHVADDLKAHKALCQQLDLPLPAQSRVTRASCWATSFLQRPGNLRIRPSENGELAGFVYGTASPTSVPFASRTLHCQTGNAFRSATDRSSILFVRSVIRAESPPHLAVWSGRHCA